MTVSTAGSSVRKEGEALLLLPPPETRGGAPGKPTRVALDSIDALVIAGSPNVSTPAIMACLERGIAVSFHQANGRLLGSVGSGLANNVTLRVAQHAWAGDPERTLTLAREFVRGKIRNQRVFLRRHGVLEGAVASEWERWRGGSTRRAMGTRCADSRAGRRGCISTDTRGCCASAGVKGSRWMGATGGRREIL